MIRSLPGFFTVRVLPVVALLLALMGCGESPLPLPLPPSETPTPANRLVFDAPISLIVKTGTILPGTTIAYNGKSETGAARILIAGLLAPKQVADAVDWAGSPVPGVSVKLNMRVATFDEQSVTLVGSAHIEISNISVQPGGSPGTAVLEFNAPVTYSLKKDEMIPGTRLAFAGGSSDGAQFLGLEGYPYRKQFDSLQYVGHLSPKVFLKLDLRVVSFSETGVVLGGTANIRVEQ